MPFSHLYPDQNIDRGVLPAHAFSARRARRIARAAGIATSMAAGAVAIGMTAPCAVAGPGGSDLQPVISELLDSQQQVYDATSKFPFVQPADLGPMLHEYTQNLASTLLASQLPGVAYNQFHEVAVTWGLPFPWDAPVTNPQNFQILLNPDDQYALIPVDSGNTYQITVEPGPGTQDATFGVLGGNGVQSVYHPLAGYNLDQFTPNANGSYTIDLSPTQHSGNWVDTAGADQVLIRDTVANWGQIHDSYSIKQLGVPVHYQTPHLSNAQLSTVLTNIAQNEVHQAQSSAYFGQMDVPQSLPVNTFSPIQPTVPFMPGPLLPGDNQFSSLGNFSLQPDQALVVKVPDVSSVYSSALVSNTFGQDAPPATATGSLSDAQAFHDPNGYTYYVISSKDPGVANWLNDGGASHGEVWLRFQGLDGPVTSTQVQAQVVNVADVRSVLPADTPVVTPAERAADIQNRLFEWDYTHDQNNGLAWLGGNLVYDQIKSAVGVDKFNEIFGGQGTALGAPQAIPSVYDRMTDPALIPSMSTIAHDFLTNPAGSLSAYIDNMPLAIKDVELPFLFTGFQLLEGLEYGDNLKGFETIFTDMLTNPTTSVTAGILNARDDLSTAVMNAPQGFMPFRDAMPLWDSLMNVNQQVVQFATQAVSQAVGNVLHPGAAASLDTTSIASAIGEWAPQAAGLLDLLP